MTIRAIRSKLIELSAVVGVFTNNTFTVFWMKDFGFWLVNHGVQGKISTDGTGELSTTIMEQYLDKIIMTIGTN